jgi:hypothetical protein
MNDAIVAANSTKAPGPPVHHVASVLPKQELNSTISVIPNTIMLISEDINNLDPVLIR